MFALDFDGSNVVPVWGLEGFGVGMSEARGGGESVKGSRSPRQSVGSGGRGGFQGNTVCSNACRHAAHHTAPLFFRLVRAHGHDQWRLTTVTTVTGS